MAGLESSMFSKPRATEQQHANGALTLWEEKSLLDNGLSIQDVLKVVRMLANRPASYTLEQIMSACETVAAHILDSKDRSDFRKRLNDVYARLQSVPKPKTEAERVTAPATSAEEKGGE